MVSRGIRAASVVVLLASMLIGGLARPAAAKPDGPSTAAVDRSCPSQYFCVWYWPGFETPKWRDIDDDADWSNGMGAVSHPGLTIANNDMSWANNGVPCAGCDHVRVYDSTSYTGALTLCVHRGQWLSTFDSSVTRNAANRGGSHRWGGECGSGEPHIPF